MEIIDDSADKAKRERYGKCRDEKIPELERLLSLYHPAQRMRKPKKDHAKTILSLKQGHDGIEGACIFPGCHIGTTKIEGMELHHYNEKESDNRIENLGLIHHPCNSSLNGKKREGLRRLLCDQTRQGGVSERDHSTVARQDVSETPYTSREGEKHDIMRYRWNGWIHDMVKGPFNGSGGKIRINALAKKAVHALGTGSSVTYRRYIEEDYYGNIFDIETDDGGFKYVVYLGPRKDPEVPK